MNAIRHGAQDYLVKGTVDGRAVAKAIRYAIDRKKTEDALRQSEAAYTVAKVSVDTVNAMEEGVALINMDGTVRSVNPALIRLSGYQKGQLEGANLDDLILRLADPAELALVQSALKTALSGEIPELREITLVSKTERRIPIIPRMAFIKDNSGKPVTIVLTVQDITEQKKAQEALEIYQDELRSLSSRLTLAEERARRQLAIALHDTVGQTLTLANLKLGSLGQLLKAKESQKALDEIREMFEEAVCQTRTLSFELSPPILYELGLGAAIEWLGEEFAKRYGFQVYFRGTTRKYAIAESVSVFLFQSARELLTNITKHAEATKVHILLKIDNGRIILKIVDNGKGMGRKESEHAIGSKNSLGLFSIRERMKHIGGTFEIQSKRGHGTKVILAALMQEPASMAADINS